jgi:5'-deoxynucleotidase YfbR-like HD superfamily hydrolase
MNRKSRALSRTWVETIGGRRFDLANPDPKDVDIHDIAAGLSKTARFNGQTHGFLSVAQHVVNTKEWLEEQGEPPIVQMAGLSHDFPEAYIHDVARPLKYMLPGYLKIERKVTDAVMKGLKLDEVLCLTKEQWKTVKRADNVMLLTERRDFKAKTKYHWHLSHSSGLQPWKRRLRRMSWWHAEQLLLETYFDLKRRIK